MYRERIGRDTLTMQVEEGTLVAQLAEQLGLAFPSVFPPADNLVIAVNQEYAEPNLSLHEEDEVVLIPPVSGGCA